MARLGVFGGTFNPPHWGHIRLAEASYTQLELDLVLWVPAGIPPHKPGRQITPGNQLDPAGRDTLASAHHRLAMTQLTIANRREFALCQLDMDRPGPHFTVDLLSLLHAQYGPAAYWFLVGQDSLRDLGSWHSPARLLELCRLAVYPRPGPPVDWPALESIVPGIRTQIDWLDGPPIELSSSSIRQRVRQGLPIDQQVPAAVCDYIDREGVYQPRG